MFYNRLKEVCKQKGATVTAMVKELGISEANLTNWKAGRLPKTDILLRISEYLGASIDYLLTGKENTATLKGDGSMYYGLWNKYCMLDNDDKDTIDGLIDTLLSKEKYNKKPDQNVG